MCLDVIEVHLFVWFQVWPNDSRQLLLHRTSRDCSWHHGLWNYITFNQLFPTWGPQYSVKIWYEINSLNSFFSFTFLWFLGFCSVKIGSFTSLYFNETIFAQKHTQPVESCYKHTFLCINRSHIKQGWKLLLKIIAFNIYFTCVVVALAVKWASSTYKPAPNDIKM